MMLNFPKPSKLWMVPVFTILGWFLGFVLVKTLLPW